MARRKNLDVRFGVKREEPTDISPPVLRGREKGPRDLSVRVGRRRPRTATEAAVLDQFGMEPGIERPGLVPLSRNPLTGNIELTMPQVGYDILRAIASPRVSFSEDYLDYPFDPQEEAANVAANFTGAGVASRFAVKPVEGVVLGMAGGPRRRAAAVVAPDSPLHYITMDYGRDIARRVRDYIDPNAPLSEYREMADRFAAAANSNFAVRPEPAFSVRPAQVATDPRIESRKGELPKVQTLEMEVQPRVMDPIKDVSIFDMEGMPFITSMSDMAAAGDDIISINGIRFRNPFSRRGGQDYMFDNPGSVWAADKGAARRLIALAERLRNKYGQNPAYFPWTMGPNAVRFSHMPRGIQYTYADAAIDAARERAALSNEIRSILPEWRDFEDPESAEMFMRASGKARGALNKLMDRYRSRGGLGIGEATYAATDLSQIGTPLMTLRNVGIIDPRFSASPSSHHSYSYHVPGYGEGRLIEQGIGALALDPSLMERLGYNSPFDYPVGKAVGVENPRRKYELQVQGGLIDDKILRLIERLQQEGEVSR